MNAAPAWLAAPWVETLGRTLLHFLWQGALLGALAWVALRLTHKCTASVRYLLAGLLMLALPVMPVATFLILAKAPPATRPTPMVMAISGLPDNQPAATGPTEAPVALPVQTLPAPKLVTITPPAARLDQTIKLAAWWLVPFWLAGVLGMAARLGIGWLRIQQWQRSATPTFDVALLASFKRLAEKFKLGQRVRLLISKHIPGPVTFGWLRPAVLLPAAMLTGLPPELLEALLAHELAHIARRDYLANLVQSAIEVVLFYHPAVWWLGARVREIREECCDELAVQACGDRLTYARALESLAELQLAAEPAAAASGGNLLARITRIVGRAPEAAGSSAVGTLLFLVAVGGLVAGLFASYIKAQDQAPSPKTNIAMSNSASSSSSNSITLNNTIVNFGGAIVAMPTPPLLPITTDTLTLKNGYAGLTPDNWRLRFIPSTFGLPSDSQASPAPPGVPLVSSGATVIYSAGTVLVPVASSTAQTAPANPDDRKAQAEKLIDELVNVSTQTVNLTTDGGGRRISKFLADDQPAMVTIGPPIDLPPTPPVMRNLVAMGVAAVPSLLDHLTDARETKLVIRNPGAPPETAAYQGVFTGVMWYSDEYDPRYRDNPARAPQKVNTVGNSMGDGGPGPGNTYTVRVGDLCYVLLGQIVDRNLVAVRYQGTSCAVINSPVHTPALAKAARQDWAGLTAEQHQASLVNDLASDGDAHLPLIYRTQHQDASERLSFYYPEAAKADAAANATSVAASTPLPKPPPPPTPIQRQLYNYEGTFADNSAAPATSTPVQGNGTLTYAASTSARQMPDSLKILTTDALTGEKITVPAFDAQWSAGSLSSSASPPITANTLITTAQKLRGTSTSTTLMLYSNNSQANTPTAKPGSNAPPSTDVGIPRYDPLHGQTMPLHYAAEPSGVANLAYENGMNDAKRIVLSPREISQLALSPPLPAYYLDAIKIADGAGMETAHFDRFHYLIGTVNRAYAEARVVQMGGKYMMGGESNVAENATNVNAEFDIMNELDKIRQLPALQGGSYEMRLMPLGELYANFIWLKSDTDGKDFLYPLSFAYDQSPPVALHTLYPVEEALQKLRPLLREKFNIDAEPQWFSDAQMNDYFVHRFETTVMGISPDMRLTIAATGGTADYGVEKVELIGISLHEVPVAFVVQRHAEDTTDFQTRDLTDFEKKALDALHQGAPTAAEVTKDGRFVVGAIRAQSSCLRCHPGAQAGDLLGAFSYRLRLLPATAATSPTP